MAKKKRFIDGIHNYCDRWCERCAFTSRCRVYAMEARRGEDHPTPVDGEPLWRQLRQILFRTERLIEATAAERGLDLDEISEDARHNPLASSHEWRSEDMPLLRDSHVYTMRLNKWLPRLELAIDRERQILNRDPNSGDERSGVDDDLVTLCDAISVIRWYEFFIHVKLVRALDTEDDDPDCEELDRFDQLGSVKVALIGIDRSLAAWHVLYDKLPARSEQILDFMLQLDRLRRTADALFPDARSFCRPGLDRPARDE